MPSEQPVEGGQREVAEVLVIDRVELDVVDQFLEIRSFNDHDAVRFEQRLKSRDDSVQIGDVGEDVVGVNDICQFALRRELLRQVATEELADRANPFLGLSDARDVAGRFDAEHRDARLLVPLKQIAIVAGDFDDETARAEVFGVRQPIRDLFGVLDHRVGERRKVRVVAEHHLGRHGFRDLHERAARTPCQFQRPCWFRLIELSFGQQRVGQRSSSQ